MSEGQILWQRASVSWAVGMSKTAAWRKNLRLESEMIMLTTPVAGSLDSKTTI